MTLTLRQARAFNVTIPEHGFTEGDKLLVNGYTYQVASVESSALLTLRSPRWYERVYWRILAWMNRWDRRFAERYDA